MKPIRVLAACPNPSDVTSWYRGFGPLNHLSKTASDIEIIPGGQDSKDYQWPQLRAADVLFFQRPGIAAHIRIIEQAREYGIPVVIDYDDDLTAVPIDNPCHPQYMTAEAKQSLVQCLKLANQVWVSTPALKEKFSQINPKTTVIPNALDDSLFHSLTIRDQREKIIVWRGSSTHAGDIMAFKDPLLEIYEKNPDWKFFFLGWNPWMLTEHMDPARHGSAPWAGIVEYFGLLSRIQAPIHIVPLKDNPFNRSKSNIAFIEGSWAGSAVLCPSWDAWKYSGSIHYEDKNSFKTQLQSMIDKKDHLMEARNLAWQTVQKELSLSQVNQLRHNSILELTGRLKK